MIILHMEHPVPNFEGWRKAFEADPIDRKASGVIKYSLYRSVLHPNYVAIDLVFEDLQNAENTLQKLQILWAKVEGNVMTGPKAELFTLLESVDL